ncbi:MAG: succinylglutamate desuccinylase/aspartoacylase family protein [Halorhabdus sp.]
MEIEILGRGDPDHAVVACVHGDEVCGKLAVESLRSEVTFRKPVKFVVANERAYRAGKQYINSNLNRSFPGDATASTHEEALASELLNELADLAVIDFHSAMTHPEPFVVVQRSNPTTHRLACATGLSKAVTFGDLVTNSLIDYVDGVAVECGYRGSDRAVENATTILRNVLATEGIIEGRSTYGKVAVYETFDHVSVKATEFTAENFRPVSAGETFAMSDDGPITADDTFTPVFMKITEDGYVKGYKSEQSHMLHW